MNLLLDTCALIALANQSLALDESGRQIDDNDRNTTKRTEDGARLFGLGAGKTKGDGGRAGSISFGEATLLAFPVRSAKGCFGWLTSPLAIQRWARATGKKINLPPIKKDNTAYFSAETLGEKLGGQANSSALFEDYVFHHAGEFDLAATLAESCSDDPVWTEMAASRRVPRRGERSILPLPAPAHSSALCR